MKLKPLAPLLTAFSIALISGPALAASVGEAEPNDAASVAQAVDPNLGGIEISAMMGSPNNPQQQDLDFFQFKARAGDVLTIDVDNAYKSSAPINTILAVFGPGPEYALLRMNDFASMDEGSNSEFDARIDEFVVPGDGTYTVGVSTVPRYFFSGGWTFTRRMMAENYVTDYQLRIDGLSADSVKKINIEVKPGSDDLAPINPRSRGKIPVAILGALDFSVVNIDTSTLTFGASGDEASLKKCSKSAEDVNGDGHNDLVCHFENQKARFNEGSLEGVLKGQLENGEMFEGRAFLKVIPK